MSKKLVAYFSASGVTKKAAERLAAAGLEGRQRSCRSLCRRQ